MSVEVYVQGLTVDCENPHEEYPAIHVWDTVLSNETHLPTIDEVAHALVMLGKMTGKEKAFQDEALKWLEEHGGVEDD